MREAIEKVIAELELDRKIATIRLEEKMSDLSVGYWTAINDKNEEFINRLKEVLNSDVPTSNRQTGTGSTDDAAK